jgi:hypothetical protein
MALPAHFVSTEIEYYYLIVVARGHITSTREGVVKATPGVDTRQALVNRALAHAMEQIGLSGGDNFTLTSIYLEPNQL